MRRMNSGVGDYDLAQDDGRDVADLRIATNQAALKRVFALSEAEVMHSGERDWWAARV